MPIHFVCPHCGVATDVSEQYVGQTGPCANCGNPTTIPNPGGATPSLSTSKKVFLILFIGVGLLGAVLGVTLGWLPAIQDHQTMARLTCASHLRQIALAIRAYEAANGCFPPAYVADRRGRPLYSWRVLLLPYLDKQDLADRFHYDEFWDSPRNQFVTDLMIGLFQCPAQPSTRSATTNYMMVVGPQTIARGRQPVKITDITDDLADTILLVEVANSDIRWAEPKDLPFDRMTFKINPRRRDSAEISSYHPDGANVAFCAEHADLQNGLVRFLKNSTDPYLIKSMLTISSREGKKGK